MGQGGFPGGLLERVGSGLNPMPFSGHAQAYKRENVITMSAELIGWRPCIMQRCSQGVSFTEALAKIQHVNCMIVQILEVKGVA